MKFAIDKIVIWPRNNKFSPRIIPLDISKINVITGGSGRGKSSIIHIIEYCLGSSRNGVSVGAIREKSAAFGLLLRVNDIEVLLIRENPLSGTSNNFIKIEDVNVPIPPFVPEYSYNRIQIIDYLNSLFNYINSGIEDKKSVNTLESQRPSFRNSVSLNYQTQNIIANQNVLFYKADNTVNREKLKIFLPYLLNIEDNQTLEYKSYLKRLERTLRIDRHNHNEKIEKFFNVNAELLGLYHKAQDFNLLPHDSDSVIDDQFVIKQLSKLKDVEVNAISIKEQQTAKTANRLLELLSDENNHAQKLDDLTRKLLLLKSVAANNIEIGNNIIQKDARLSPVTWLLNHKINNHNCPFCQTPLLVSEELQVLQKLRSRMNDQLGKVQDSTQIFRKEIQNVQRDISKMEVALNEIRTVISIEIGNEESNKFIKTTASINKFIGAATTTIDEYLKLEDELSSFDLTYLEDEIIRVRKIVGQDALKARFEKTINKVSKKIKKYAELLSLYGSEQSILLDIKNDLTLVFTTETGDSFTLSQMGSGENYMGYHVSTILAIHEYLAKTLDSKIAPFIILDQPSQAYFPEGDNENDEDTNKLRSLFSTLSEFHKKTEGKVQVIVLEHAGMKNWEEFDNIVMVERWRDNIQNIDLSKLIPLSWF